MQSEISLIFFHLGNLIVLQKLELLLPALLSILSCCLSLVSFLFWLYLPTFMFQGRHRTDGLIIFSFQFLLQQRGDWMGRAVQQFLYHQKNMRRDEKP